MQVVVDYAHCPNPPRYAIYWMQLKQRAVTKPVLFAVIHEFQKEFASLTQTLKILLTLLKSTIFTYDWARLECGTMKQSYKIETDAGLLLAMIYGKTTVIFSQKNYA